jgi:hypothetical protein
MEGQVGIKWDTYMYQEIQPVVRKLGKYLIYQQDELKN